MSNFENLFFSFCFLNCCCTKLFSSHNQLLFCHALWSKNVLVQDGQAFMPRAHWGHLAHYRGNAADTTGLPFSKGTRLRCGKRKENTHSWPETLTKNQPPGVEKENLDMAIFSCPENLQQLCYNCGIWFTTLGRCQLERKCYNKWKTKTHFSQFRKIVYLTSRFLQAWVTVTSLPEVDIKELNFSLR